MSVPSPMPARRIQETPGQHAEGLPRIPDHRLLRRIGAGSYGSVWLAQTIMGAYRAVKVVHRGDFEDDRPFEREFRGIQKFEPISRQHDSQVDILHVGRTADCFFYVMEVADDERSGQRIDPAYYTPRTLASELKQRGLLPFGECVGIGLALTTALGHLHKHRLIHRDIKPANVIFVNGVPKLADIGLITEVTATRSFVGTEGFIPPEGPGTVQADIYSLGKVLYEMATGRDRRDFPELSTKLWDSLERDQLAELNEVIVRACELDPERRYASADEMHADLALLLTGKSVKHQRVMQRRLRAARRTGLAAGIVAVLAGAAYYEARQAEKTATDHLVQMNVANGVARMEEGNYQGSLIWFANAIALGRAHEPLNSLNRLRMAILLDQIPKLNQMFFHRELINDAEFSPDGRFLATASYDHTARIWDLATGQPRTPPLQHSDDVRSATFSPDGRWLVTASNDHTARIWDAITGQLAVPELRHGAEVAYACFSPDGRRVVTASGDHTARIWDAKTGRLMFSLRHSDMVDWAQFSPDGRRVVTASRDFTARIWDAETGKPVGAPLVHGARVRMAIFSPDGRRIGTASDDATARIWDADTGQPLNISLRHRDWVLSIAFSPDGTLFATASKDYSAQVWDARTGEPLGRRILHGNRVTRVAFSVDGRWLLTASSDHTVSVWNARTGLLAVPPLQHNAGVITAGFSPNGRQVVSAGHDAVARVWDLSALSSGRLRLPTEVLSGWFSPDASCVSSCSVPDRRLRIWQVRNGQLLPGSASSLVTEVPTGRTSLPRVVCFSSAKDRPWLLYNDYAQWATEVWNFRTGTSVTDPHTFVSGATFSPDGRTVATMISRFAPHRPGEQPDDQLWVRDAATLHRLASVDLRRLGFHEGWSVAVAFSPDGRRVAIGLGNINQKTNGYAQVLDATTGRTLTPPMEHPAAVVRVAFSPDGHMLLTGCDDASSDPMEARVWDAATGRPIGPPLRHGDGINAVKWSPDGSRVLTASEDNTARVWNARTGEPATPPLEHPRQVQDADFSPDGRLIVTACIDGTIRVWDATTGQPVSPPLGSADSVDHPVLSVGVTPEGQWVFSAEQSTFHGDELARIAPGILPPSMWRLKPTTLPAPELMEVAQALTGQWIDASGAAVPMDPEILRDVWEKTRTRYPELFTTSTERVIQWRYDQAQESQASHKGRIFLLAP